MRQTLDAGRWQQAFEQELQALQDARLLPHLWEKDAALWPPEQFEQSHIRVNLDWLDLAESLEMRLGHFSETLKDIANTGLRDSVMIAKGAANFACKAVLALVPPDAKEDFLILESADPAAIRRIERQIDLATTLFVLAHKSGAELEEHSLFLYFQKLLISEQIPEPNGHFVSTTDLGSYLDSISRGYSFRAVFFDPADTSGLYQLIVYQDGAMDRHISISLCEAICCSAGCSATASSSDQRRK